jgi:hypothetical protein
MTRLTMLVACSFLMLAGCNGSKSGGPRAANSSPSQTDAAGQPSGTPSPLNQSILMGATSFRYTVGDDSGQALAYGTLIIPWPVSDGQTFRGTWQARPVLPSTTAPTNEVPRIGPQLGGGQLAGERSDNTLRFDLNPGMRDNNVTLTGELDETGQKLVGLWSWSTMKGHTKGGKFAARLSD